MSFDRRADWQFTAHYIAIAQPAILMLRFNPHPHRGQRVSHRPGAGLLKDAVAFANNPRLKRNREPEHVSHAAKAGKARRNAVIVGGGAEGERESELTEAPGIQRDGSAVVVFFSQPCSRWACG